MYAVIESGGKQYRVSEGQTIKVEKISADEGSSVEIDKVLMVNENGNLSIGKPFVDGGKVSATVENHGRAKKIRIIKFRRRKHHLKQMGHRQAYTSLKITEISAG